MKKLLSKQRQLASTMKVMKIIQAVTLTFGRENMKRNISHEFQARRLRHPCTRLLEIRIRF